MTLYDVMLRFVMFVVFCCGVVPLANVTVVLVKLATIVTFFPVMFTVAVILAVPLRG